MLLQGLVESKELKGYIVNLGFKDSAKGFVPFDTVSKNLSAGSLVHVLVKSQTSKVIRCELANSDNCNQVVQTSLADVTLHTLKPGYLVSAKIVKLFENGLELSFLGGMRGTVFADHLNKDSIAKYKTGEKLQARVISQDVAGKKTTLSLLPQIIQLESKKRKCKVGEIFEDVKVDKILFGNSFLIKLGDDLKGFLHKSNIPKEDEEESEQEDEEETKVASSKPKKKKKSQVDLEGESLLKVGQIIS